MHHVRFSRRALVQGAAGLVAGIGMPRIAKAQTEAIRIGQALERVRDLRRDIREAGDDVPDWRLRDMWDEAQHELLDVRLYGDLVIASFFAGSKPTERDTARARYADAVMNGQAAQLAGAVELLSA